MIGSRVLRPVVAVLVFGLLSWVSSAAPAAARPAPRGELVLAASAETVGIAPLPCDRRGEIEVSMTNTGQTSGFVDAVFEVPPELVLSRYSWTTYLPAADPDQRVSGPLRITAAVGAKPGEYTVRMTANGQRLDLPVTVSAAPGTEPGANLALYRQAVASSTHPNVALCGGVDGNSDSEQWGASGTHDRTSGVFPDTYGVRLDGPFPIDRVELYTLDSQKYPAAKMGVRDVDVQARVDGNWQTVRSVRGNEVGHLSLEFPAVTADRVRVLVLDSNDHKYSRVVELEVYRGTGV